MTTLTSAIALPKQSPMLANPKELPEGTTTIVKLQRGKGPKLSWMAYAIDYSSLRLVKPQDIPSWAQDSMGDARKAYFQASLYDGRWKLNQRVQDQEW